MFSSYWALKLSMEFSLLQSYTLLLIFFRWRCSFSIRSFAGTSRGEGAKQKSLRDSAL